ncbi:50S ribosomal protein L22 [Gottschalkiaceae bacterium SANA]|nr:50S ribosomal protein L22 [Gottschalkiaceae bacterium SANA]
MEARAIAKYIRISPRKVQEVADLVRGKNVNEALAILEFTNKRGAGILKKVVGSAVANAENNNDMDRENLYIAEVFANQGPTLKRFQPRAQGRAFTIRKRTSHIGVVVKEK